MSDTAIGYDPARLSVLESEAVQLIRTIGSRHDRSVGVRCNGDSGRVLQRLAIESFQPDDVPFTLVGERDDTAGFDVVIDSEFGCSAPQLDLWSLGVGWRRSNGQTWVHPLWNWSVDDIERSSADSSGSSDLAALQPNSTGATRIVRVVAMGTDASALIDRLSGSADASGARFRRVETARRSFAVSLIDDGPIADLVMGASTANIAVLVADARRPIDEQVRRQSVVVGLLGVAHVVLCIDRLDASNESAQLFYEVAENFRKFAAKLDVPDLSILPVCVSTGENVVHRSSELPWYQGGSLMHLLEQVQPSSDRNLIDARMVVQHVRAQGHCAGTVASGTFELGDEVVALSSGCTSTVESVRTPSGAKVDRAQPGSAVNVQLTGDVEVRTGDLLCRPNNRPLVGREIDAMVTWFSDASSLEAGASLSLIHATRTVPVSVTRVDYRLDIDTLHRSTTAKCLRANDIGRVQLHLPVPLMFDSYRRNHVTGAFALTKDPSGELVGAGVITGPTLVPNEVVWHSAGVSRSDRPTVGMTVWLTGLSASGKSSIAVELERRLIAAGRPAYRLDGDNLRHGLNADLGFGAADRDENVRRVGAVAQLLADSGVVAIASLISPMRDARDRIRAAHAEEGLPFVEIFVDTPVAVCERRDPKGMYAKARAGEIIGFTGVDAPYEAPLAAELVLRPEDGDAAAQVARILEVLSL